MSIDNLNTISVNASFNLDATPDCTLIKLHFIGEGMTLEDAVSSVQVKVAEATEALRNRHSTIESVDVFDVYFGQKSDRIRTEAQAFPRPLAVQGLIICVSPADTATHYRIVDDGIKRGALLENPNRPSYLSDTLDSAILYGLVDSHAYEQTAMEGCLKEAVRRAESIAAGIGRKLGQLVAVSNSTLEPSMGNPQRNGYLFMSRSLPTKYLSPTPQKVIIAAKLTATYAIAQ